MKFSDRIGKTKPKEIIQIDSMDQDLRNSLWNLFYLDIAQPLFEADYGNETLYISTWQNFAFTVWISYFKEPIDTMSMSKKAFVHNIRDRFFRWTYLELYNFLDFIVSIDSPIDLESFFSDANNVLERELSGFRFINNVLAPITNKIEIQTIEQALISTHNEKLKPINIHLNESLILISDKSNPDYRNSIKESISAIESFCKIITDSPSSDLGKTLKTLDNYIHIHPALQQGFLKIYAYSSDGDGIRHGLSDEPNISLEDAQFMLISCSSFINYLISKASKAGIIQ